jgi:hypothetical protein
VNAVKLLRVLNATMAIAQLTVMRVNGVVGVRAQRNAAVAVDTAVALRPHHNMEVVNAVTVLRVVNATLTTAQLTAMRVNGVIGVRAPKPVAMVFPTAPAS